MTRGPLPNRPADPGEAPLTRNLPWWAVRPLGPLGPTGASGVASVGPSTQAAALDAAPHMRSEA